MYNPKTEKRNTIKHAERGSKQISRNYTMPWTSHEENFNSMKMNSNYELKNTQKRPWPKGENWFICFYPKYCSLIYFKYILKIYFSELYSW